MHKKNKNVEVVCGCARMQGREERDKTKKSLIKVPPLGQIQHATCSFLSLSLPLALSSHCMQ